MFILQNIIRVLSPISVKKLVLTSKPFLPNLPETLFLFPQSSRNTVYQSYCNYPRNLSHCFSANIQKLKERIRTAFDGVTLEMRETSLVQYRSRLQKLIEIDGGHVEVHSD